MSETAVAAGVLIDSNVLIDIVSADARWSRWSAQAIDRAAEAGPILVNPVIYAELSARFVRVEDVDAVLPADRFIRAAIPWDAAFLAGQCFVQYRRRGGERRSPLPDFFIGAHAAVSRLRLLTRDAARYRTYFPSVELICPP